MFIFLPLSCTRHQYVKYLQTENKIQDHDHGVKKTSTYTEPNTYSVHDGCLGHPIIKETAGTHGSRQACIFAKREKFSKMEAFDWSIKKCMF